MSGNLPKSGPEPDFSVLVVPNVQTAWLSHRYGRKWYFWAIQFFSQKCWSHDWRTYGFHQNSLASETQLTMKIHQKMQVWHKMQLKYSRKTGNSKNPSQGVFLWGIKKLPWKNLLNPMNLRDTITSAHFYSKFANHNGVKSELNHQNIPIYL